MTMNIEIIQLVGNLLLLPMGSLIWGMNTRLSKMESSIEHLRADMLHNHAENIARISSRRFRDGD